MPQRPGWTCRTCGEAWPCEPGRAELVGEFTGTPAVFAVYMSICFGEACVDLPEVETDALYRRFLGWLRDLPTSV